MCGICAIWGKNQNLNLPLLIESLKNLQHRGQESFGYATISNQQTIETTRVEGLAREYQLENNISTPFAIGHLRYSTSGSKSILASQPITNQLFSIVHNGNIPNRNKLLSLLSEETIQEEYLSDTQLLERYLYQELNKTQSFPSVLHNLLSTINGVYNLIILTRDSLWIVRDSTGIRPLILAKSPDNQTIVIASESCVLSSRSFYDYQFQDIAEGSITEITLNGQIINHPTSIISKPTPCLFEFIYFLDPRSVVSGQSVLEFREESGRLLASEESLEMKEYFQKNKDKIVVIGAPSTGNPSAKAYAEEIGLVYDLNILTKKPKTERTFILKDNNERRKAVADKYNYDESKINDKIIIVVDDSLVRGNTISIINQNLQDYGAKEIHVRIASPPVKYPCLCGIDIPTKEELIANQENFSPELIKADSLLYLSLDKIKTINNKLEYYQGCFDGNYPEI